jgi:folate-binding protein YgfZ
MSTPAASCLLDDLGVLRFRGADTRKFLQGQLSNDIERLRSGALLRAGIHNPQGRTLALLALIPDGEADVLALMPRDQLAAISTLLKRYVLRSKVTIGDETEHLCIVGLGNVDALASTPGLRASYLSGDPRALLLTPAGDAAQVAVDMKREQWRALDIAAGLPEVPAAICGQFVSQMLNLDCIEAISFDKGCYTGQEIIARAHYRGRVKRRMQRFISEEPASLSVGASARLRDGRHLRVVQAVTASDGRCEFLAVAHLPGAAPDAEPQDPVPDGTTDHTLAAHSLPLPYALP